LYRKAFSAADLYTSENSFYKALHQHTLFRSVLSAEGGNSGCSCGCAAGRAFVTLARRGSVAAPRRARSFNHVYSADQDESTGRTCMQIEKLLTRKSSGGHQAKRRKEEKPVCKSSSRINDIKILI
jgi:hypothetical protein